MSFEKEFPSIQLESGFNEFDPLQKDVIMDCCVDRRKVKEVVDNVMMEYPDTDVGVRTRIFELLKISSLSQEGCHDETDS